MDYKEKVIALLNSKELSKEQKEKLEVIFPELKESEDERIRKELLQIAKESEDSFYMVMTPNKREKLIAWLERQGEQKAWSEEDKNMLKWVIGYLENKMLNAPISEERTACKNAIAWFEEKLKGEQKPVEWTMDNIEELTEFESAMMHIGGSFFGEHQGLDPNDTNAIKEQANILLEFVPKQEWSEEDETKIKSIIALLKSPAVCTMDGNKGIIDASIKYLKSLKDRIQPQLKQEWSEEDERFLNVAINILNSSKVYTKSSDKYEDTINWLKGIKDRVQPQSQWKPSDEQIKALETTLYTNMSRNDERYLVLSEFVTELKKLKSYESKIQRS